LLLVNDFLGGWGESTPPNAEEEAKPDDETKDLRRKALNLKPAPARTAHQG
jgi:hypothetical protein